MLVIYGGLIGLTYFQFGRTPSGFIPPLDRAYFITVVTLPPGASLERTDAVIRDASKLLLSRPGVAHTVTFAGFDGATSTNAPNIGVIFTPLKPFEERVKEGLSAADILSDLRRQMQALREAFILVLPPPSVPGIGTGGGFKLYVQDRAGRGPQALERAVGGISGLANGTPGLVQVFTLFNAATPQVYADIDRTKAEMLGVPISRFFDTLTTYMGSTYVNDFNILGRTYRVIAQADNPFRLIDPRCRVAAHELDRVGNGAAGRRRDLQRRHRAVARSALQSVPRCRGPRLDAAGLLHRAGHRSNGKDPGRLICHRVSASSGPKSRCRKRSREIPLASRSASPSCSFFCLLAAQYESVLLPVAVILIVPMCLVRGDQRRAAPRDGQQHPHPDRIRGPDRARCEKRHSDRRVCQAGGGNTAPRDWTPPCKRRGRACVQS